MIASCLSRAMFPCPRPFKTSETALRDTPARSATSCAVALRTTLPPLAHLLSTSATILAGGIKGSPVENEPAVGDPSVTDGHALGAWGTLDKRCLGVVHDQCRLQVTEGGDELRAGEHLHKRAHELAIRSGALQPTGRRVANNVVSDIAHGLVQIMTCPGLRGRSALRRARGLSIPSS